MIPTSRRRFLAAGGAALALARLGRAAPEGEAPRRLLHVYVPNGVHLPAWDLTGGPVSTPTAGSLPAALSPILSELERHRGDWTLLSGLCLDKARENGDGAGDHARAMAAFLTCAQPYKGDGERLEVGVSADQLAAEVLGRATPFPSLQLCGEGALSAGQCDSGYPCVYSSHLSWATPRTPLAPEASPAALFDRLFAPGEEALDEEQRRRRARRRRSVLDFARREARAVHASASRGDRHKLEEFSDALRDLERRIDAATAGPGFLAPRPEDAPDLETRIELLADVLVLALAADLTRVATFAVANEGSSYVYRSLGVEGSHHPITHHAGDPGLIEDVVRINRFHAGFLARLCDRLREVREGGGRLLDHTLVLYGSGNADGSTHAHHDLPLVLAGGMRALPRAEWLRFPPETPLADLHAALLAAVGAPLAKGRFADGRGALDLGVGRGA